MRTFVAGATGATGAVFVPRAAQRGHDLVLHVRPATAPRHAFGQDPRASIFDLNDVSALDAALAGCAAIVSLVGTMKSRFAAGDTYASADVESTRLLVAAALRVGVPRFLLLSSYGAGGMGAYLQMKAECERLVREANGFRWTIFRPSSLVSPPGVGGSHGERGEPPFVGALGRGVRALPGLRGFADDWRPIPLTVLANAMVSVLESPRDGEMLTGRDLWPLGDV